MPHRGTKIVSFNRFELEVTYHQADTIQAIRGRDCSPELEAFLEEDPELDMQLDEIGTDLIAYELREYGAWDDDELSDPRENKLRLFWIACTNDD